MDFPYYGWSVFDQCREMDLGFNFVSFNQMNPGPGGSEEALTVCSVCHFLFDPTSGETPPEKADVLIDEARVGDVCKSCRRDEEVWPRG